MKRKYVLFFVLYLLLDNALATSRISQETIQKLTNELPMLGLSAGDAVFIRAFKTESQLELWMQPKGQKKFILFRTYPICFYSGDLGPKRHTGDKMTPEGFYSITQQRLNPYSRFHLSMNIGYPNAYDRYLGRTGSLLMIHGACDAVGCFAMSNPQIEEIYYLVKKAINNGQPRVQVHAFPFHLTAQQLNEHKTNKWYGFWLQLQTGYLAFNETQIPPIVTAIKGRYVIEKQ